jgi:molybdopterin/thiamine biosynthesis adenylyltransferase
VKLVVVAQTGRKSRKTMLGAGIGKIWLADDWDSDETNLEIQQMFEQNNEMDKPA